MMRNVESSIIIALSSHIYDIVILCCNADVPTLFVVFLVLCQEKRQIPQNRLSSVSVTCTRMFEWQTG